MSGLWRSGTPRPVQGTQRWPEQTVSPTHRAGNGNVVLKGLETFLALCELGCWIRPHLSKLLRAYSFWVRYHTSMKSNDMQTRSKQIRYGLRRKDSREREGFHHRSGQDRGNLTKTGHF